VAGNRPSLTARPASKRSLGLALKLAATGAGRQLWESPLLLLDDVLPSLMRSAKHCCLGGPWG